MVNGLPSLPAPFDMSAGAVSIKLPPVPRESAHGEDDGRAARRRLEEPASFRTQGRERPQRARWAGKRRLVRRDLEPDSGLLARQPRMRPLLRNADRGAARANGR